MQLAKIFNSTIFEIGDDIIQVSHGSEGCQTQRFIAVGMSLELTAIDALNMPFLGFSGLINITLGRASYYVAIHHGIEAGHFCGSKSTNLERLATVYPGADIYLEGHRTLINYIRFRVSGFGCQ